MKTGYAGISFFLLIFHISLSAQEIEFYKEDIIFSLSPKYFQVEGIYYFSNVGDKPVNTILFYPFPQDSIYGKVDSVFIMNMNDSTPKDIILKKNSEGVFYPVKLAPYNMTKFKIYYRQELLNGRAEYILTSTRKWKKPLRQAEYQLIVPEDIHISFTSYKPDSIKTSDSIKVYFWDKKDFMPDKNMVFKFDYHQDTKQ